MVRSRASKNVIMSIIVFNFLRMTTFSCSYRVAPQNFPSARQYRITDIKYMNFCNTFTPKFRTTVFTVVEPRATCQTNTAESFASRQSIHQILSLETKNYLVGGVCSRCGEPPVYPYQHLHCCPEPLTHVNCAHAANFFAALLF